ncbi:MAG: hypothetical protein EAZ30_03405 [Betaproteobacteria bacterium]|nr:MAG: hypothetical protein EAZ30_03405 [Betaproteobacteria bacterium]
MFHINNPLEGGEATARHKFEPHRVNEPLKEKRDMASNKKSKKNQTQTLLLPADLGISDSLYATCVTFLFDRPEKDELNGEAWYWSLDADEHEFNPSPIEWVKLQTLIFARCGEDLKRFSDEQVGLGLNYLMSNAVGDASCAAADPSVSIDDAMRMMEHFPTLWRACIGPRLAGVHNRIGYGNGELGYVCYMWFDVWPTFYQNRNKPEWRDAMWRLFVELLSMPCREVQVSALHGLGHEGRYLGRKKDIDQLIYTFVASVASTDEALIDYAEAARQGMVQ